MGIAYPYYHHRVSFSDKTITTVFNQKEFKQRFTFASIKNLNLTSVSKYGYKSSMTDKSVYVFFKLGCPYCQNSIPNLLEKLTEEEKKQVFFINLDDEKSNKLAQHLNINKAGTSLIVDHTSKSKKASFYYLFKINNGKAAANQESIFKIKQYLNRVVWNTRVIK
ncbi:TPA: hypothetical protein U9H89_002115 [Streptococcus agalactiae]|nr:hypothetical protein [Streptococcus agalactiae]